VLISCLGFLLFAPAETKPAYARPKLLIEPSEISKPHVARLVHILDARPRAEYRKGHVLGAVWLDAKHWERTFAKDRTAATWKKFVGRIDVMPDSHVVVYDANRSKDAARMWWILRYWGVKNVRILNGGWSGWVDAGGRTTTIESKPGRSHPELTAEPGRLATKGQILKGLRAGSVQILDARSEKEYCGTTSTAKRNGTIPGAKRLEWSDTLDDKGRFKTAAELRELFRRAGINPTRPATTFCQSGGRAAVLAFVLELMGGKDVRNYYRSWAEWGNDKDTPVEKPKPLSSGR
jgi:thiosulfate/3-mercaptopyruvate sulfurtransferase